MSDGFALVLVEQRDGVDERQVFLMVAAGARAAAGEGQVPGLNTLRS